MQDIAILIDFTIGLFLTADDQHAVARADVDVRLVHAWQFRRDLHLLVGFGDVDLDAELSKNEPGQPEKGEKGTFDNRRKSAKARLTWF